MLDLKSLPVSNLSPETLHNFSVLKNFKAPDIQAELGPMFENPLSGIIDPVKEKFNSLVGTDPVAKLNDVMDTAKQDWKTAQDTMAQHIKALDNLASNAGSGGGEGGGLPQVLSNGMTPAQLRDALVQQRQQVFQSAAGLQKFAEHTDIISQVKQPEPGATIKLQQEVTPQNPTGDTGVPVPTGDSRAAVAESANRLHMSVMQDAGCEPPAGEVVGCQNNACVAGSVTQGDGSQHLQTAHQSLQQVPPGTPGNPEDAVRLHDALQAQQPQLQQSQQGLQQTVEQENSCYVNSYQDLQSLMDAMQEDGCAGAMTGATMNPTPSHQIQQGPPPAEPPKGTPVDCDKLDLDQMISRHFRLRDLLVTQVKAKNCPANDGVIQNLKALATNALDKIKDQYPGMRINSAYRSPAVNSAVGGANNSQHSRGQAADIKVPGVSNADLALWVKSNIPFDQLILEFHHAGQPSSGWVHVSYNSGGGRKHAFRIGGSGKVSGFA